MGSLLAQRLQGELDVVLVRKLRSPFSPEYAIGSVDETGWTYLAPHAHGAGASDRYIEEEKREQRRVLRERRSRYSPGRGAKDPAGRSVLVFAFAAPDSGVPAAWTATRSRAGVNFLESISARSAERVAGVVAAQRQPGDLVVVSLHWGGNWGFAIPPEQRSFAHALVDAGGADIVHGHSSHHAKGIEVYRQRLVLYGCGDFVNDYEGIAGHEHYRSELAPMYFPVLDHGSGALVELQVVPLRRRRLRLERADAAARHWLVQMLQQQGEPLGIRAVAEAGDALSLAW